MFRNMTSMSRIVALFLVAAALVAERAPFATCKNYAFDGRIKSMSKLDADSLDTVNVASTPESVSAASALNQLCDHPASQSIGLVRSESRRHLSALLNEPWDSSSGSGLVSRTSKAMCCVLRTGSIWHQYAAARIIAAMGNASISLRRVVCSVIAVHCSREVVQLASMIHTAHNASSDADSVAALQAVSALSIYLPEGIVMPALHSGLSHPGRSVREAAASSILRLLTDIKAITKDQHFHILYGQLVSDLLDNGVLLLLLKSSREGPISKAVIATLQPFFDEYAKEYLLAAQTLLVHQNAQCCRSLLKAGTAASASRNTSTASLMAWAHTRSAHWATASCPLPSNLSVILFPCALRNAERVAASADPCLESYIDFFHCNAHAQGTMLVSPQQASTMCHSKAISARRCDYAHDGLCTWDGISSPLFSVVKTARTWAGSMLYHARDLYFRISLELYGEWAHDEVDFIMRFLPPGATVVDAGAHVGTISIALARHLGPSSTVIAIEATRFFSSLARSNAAAAGLYHMHVIHAALGNASGCLMARSDHTHTAVSNVGGHKVIGCPEHVRRSCASRNCAIHGETFYDGTGTYEWVPTVLLDDLGLQRCDVLKMDVEAMEEAVAQGARNTIAAFKPMVFYEDNSASTQRDDSSSPSFMDQFGYKCFSRSSSLWRPNNWAGSPRDVFSFNGRSSQHQMLFCVHPESHWGQDAFFRN